MSAWDFFDKPSKGARRKRWLGLRCELWKATERREMTDVTVRLCQPVEERVERKRVAALCACHGCRRENESKDSPL
jgi:hypothetical protein